MRLEITNKCQDNSVKSILSNLKKVVIYYTVCPICTYTIYSKFDFSPFRSIAPNYITTLLKTDFKHALLYYLRMESTPEINSTL